MTDGRPRRHDNVLPSSCPEFAETASFRSATGRRLHKRTNARRLHVRAEVPNDKTDTNGQAAKGYFSDMAFINPGATDRRGLRTLFRTSGDLKHR
jgi:hypothetical protein